jgi:hypothetical protein
LLEIRLQQLYKENIKGLIYLIELYDMVIMGEQNM